MHVFELEWMEHFSGCYFFCEFRAAIFLNDIRRLMKMPGILAVGPTLLGWFYRRCVATNFFYRRCDRKTYFLS